MSTTAFVVATGASIRGGLLVVATFGWTATLGNGQDLLWDWHGESASDIFGTRVSAVGDIDADGVADILVGTEFQGLSDRGRAYAYSGKTGLNLYTWTGEKHWDWFGSSVGSVGDLDGDGHDDVLVGAPGSDSNGRYAGRAYIYSGRHGSLMMTFDGQQDYLLGSGFAGSGDLNGDAWPDLVIAAIGAGNPQTSEVYIYSGSDFSLLGTVVGDGPYYFGFSMAICADLDGDSCDDLVIGAEENDANGTDAGQVYVYSGKSLTLLYTLQGEQPGAFFGHSVSTVADFDGDGLGDFAVGAWEQDTTAYGAGRAYLYSGTTGLAYWTIDGEYSPAWLGSSVAGAGDCNDDGMPELIVGAATAPGFPTQEGEAYLYSGRTRRLLYRFQGEGDYEVFGYQVAYSSDLDGDGIGDLVIAAPYHDDRRIHNGRVAVFRGNDLFLQVTPTIALAGDVVTLNTRGGVPALPAVLFVVDVNGIPTWAAIAITALDANGEVEITGTVPTGLSGQTITLLSLSFGWSGGLADSSIAMLAFQ